MSGLTYKRQSGPWNIYKHISANIKNQLEKGKGFSVHTLEKLCFLHDMEESLNLSEILCRKYGKSN